MRRILRPIVCPILRIFFRRVEVLGLERVPERGPVIFVLNHPNALIDPLFLECRSPRPVSFLAKEPLFRMPVIGFFVRAFDSLPVYRQQDEGSDPRWNLKTFERARALLARGRAIAIFPEGTSHSGPKLRRLKTGTARIALGTAALTADARRVPTSVGPGARARTDVPQDADAPLRIVPAGLYYTAKGTFRSSALLVFGEPIVVEPAGLEPDGNPPARAVRALTAEIERALCEVTLQGEREEALSLIGRAQRIFSADGTGPAAASDLAREFELRRRFLAGYALLRTRCPERLADLEARVLRYEEELLRVGLGPRLVSPSRLCFASFVPYLARRLLALALLLPAGIVGAVVHYPAYRGAGFLATRVAEGADVLATVKVLAAMLLFPVTWIALAIGGTAALSPVAGVATLVVAPVTGYAALAFIETLGDFAGAVRAFALVTLRPGTVHRLAEEGRAIREEIAQLGQLVEPT